jgi:H+-translocating NAD(P) transhydrogenase subunit beta
VPPTLHTPLMSGANAISGITIVGALVVAGSGLGWISTVLGFLAIVFAMINVAGGYTVTDRMLQMFRKERRAMIPARSSPSSTWSRGPLHPRAEAALEPGDGARGERLSGLGMLLAVVVTLFDRAILSYGVIAPGIVVGTAIGFWMARSVKMTSMPQMVALLNGFGGAASLTVGGAEFLRASWGRGPPARRGVTIQLAILIGAVTFTGSLVAFAKLQELMTGPADRLRRPEGGQRLDLSARSSAWQVYQAVVPEPLLGPFYTVVALSLLWGHARDPDRRRGHAGGDLAAELVLRARGGDDRVRHRQPRADHRRRARGLVRVHPEPDHVPRDEPVADERAVRRLRRGGSATARSSEGLTVNQVGVEDAAIQLAYARLVVVIPGYGLAVAQAQHQVRELAELIEKQGGEVGTRSTPSPGRMPGHMNVLLSEANVSYDRLITDVDEANAPLARADIAIVIGANDIVNPAALEDPGLADLRNADHPRRHGPAYHRHEAEHGERLRGDRERPVLPRQHVYALRGREADAQRPDHGDQAGGGGGGVNVLRRTHVLIDQLRHLEHRDLVLPTKDWLELGVGTDGSAVIRVLEVVLLDVVPDLLGEGGARQGFAPDDGGESGVGLHRLGEAALRVPLRLGCTLADLASALLLGH